MCVMTKGSKKLPQSAAEHGTQKLYLDEYDALAFDATIITVSSEPRKTLHKTPKNQLLGVGPLADSAVVVLDQTAFYPGGGGQACDVGVIEWDGGSLELERVSKDDDGIVYHHGTLSGNEPSAGQAVTCHVDSERRSLNSRLHSAGHLLDLAVTRAGYDWVPGKAAHYPHMCFVEYSGQYNGEQREEYLQTIQREIDAIIREGGAVVPHRCTPDEARQRSKYIPEVMLQKYQLVHVARYGKDFDICCGGTHVSDIASIGHVSVDRIKKKDGNIRVSYSV